ncbi:MAG: rod shape-determining protein MreD [Candidatus Omnitrophota bacterium]
MNKTRFLAFLWIFLLFLAQNASHVLFSGEFVPLLLIAVVYYALLEGASFGFLSGCFAGFLLDLFGIGRIGTQMAIFGCLGAFSGLVASKIFRDSFFTQVFLPALGSYFTALSNLVIFRMSAGQETLGWGLFWDAAAWPHLILTAVLSPFIFRFLKKVSLVRAERSSIWRVG